MSTVLTCRDLSFVGGQRDNCPYTGQTSADSVDVTTETLASSRAVGPPDYTSCQREPAETLACFNYGTPDPIWTDHLSPHLSRNKQLQDTLILREEELARLQAENNRLKEFVNSSYVKNLEEKSKRFLSAKKNRKRNQRAKEEELQNLSTSQLLFSSQVKRTRRNLSLEFCTAEELASTSPVDHWILRTLGLKDADTIDPSAGFSFSSPFDSDTKRSPNQDPSDNYCPTTSEEMSNYRSPIRATDPCPCVELSTNYSPNFNPMTVSRDPCCNVTATGSAVLFSPNIVVTPKYHVTPFQSTLTLVNNPLSTQDIQPFSPTVTSSPVLSQDRCPRLSGAPSRHCRSLSGSPLNPAPSPLGPSAPCCRTDVAFSMSLSSSSSVRTHSFPQGQAFVRKHTRGGWSFTWVPKQGP